MIIAGLNIQPLLLYLSDTQYWLDRWEKGKKHFAEIGLRGIISVAGIHAEKFGVIGTHPYKIDNPDSDEIITRAKVGSFLSMYVMYSVANVLPNEYFMFLEDDSRMQPDFLAKLNAELQNVPPDFDFVFVSSCCAKDKDPIHVKGDVYTFKHNPEKLSYPMCGNCYIVAKKALPYIISTQRDCYAPADISLPIHTFPNLKVYAILPRLAEQDGVENLAP